MKNLTHILVLSIALMFTGCASLPTPEKMKADVAGYKLPKLPEAGKAIVYVVRPSSLGSFVRFNVFVDDKEATSEMGFTRGNQYIHFNLKPGDHQILSKAENWSAANVSAKAGDIIFIRQEPTAGIIMARNSIFKLEDYEGKYHVKRLKLGTIKKSDK